MSQPTDGVTSSPAWLWQKALVEHPHDEGARRARYRELLVEHGHIVKREPGESVNLPCGWPHRPELADVAKGCNCTQNRPDLHGHHPKCRLANG